MDPHKTRPLVMRVGNCARAVSLRLVALAVLFGAANAAAAGSLFVTSQLDHTVKEYDATTGAFIRNAATGIGDPLDAIVGADGNLLVTDGQQDAIKRFDRTTGGFLGVFASVVSPLGMTISGGKVYVCQTNPPQIIRSFDAVTGADVGSFVPTVGGGNPSPRDVKVASGRLYVSYWNLGTIEVFDVLTRQSLGLLIPPGAGGLSTPFSIAFGPDGNLYVSYNFFVNRYDPSSGAFLGQFVDTGDRTGLRYAVGIAWGPDGNLYVATQNTPGVQRYNGTTGAFINDFVPAGSGGLTAPFHISFASTQALCSNNTLPFFISPTPQCGSTIDATASSPVTFTVSAADNDVLSAGGPQPVKLDVMGLPAGATMTPGLPTTGNPVSSTFHWTPTPGDAGDHTITFTANDGCVTVPCDITIHVNSCTVDCSQALACMPVLWPPNHKYMPVSICGVTESCGNPVAITVTSITQDEPVNGRGDGNTCPDAQIVDGHASVRAERTGTPGVPGNGRVYAINFTATNGQGSSCRGTVTVCVPHDQGDRTCINDGQRYNSLGPCTSADQLQTEVTNLNVSGLSSSRADLSFTLASDAHVDLAVFDVAGRRLATLENADLAQGTYQRSWNMDGARSGLYFVRMLVNGQRLTRTVVKAQ